MFQFAGKYHALTILACILAVLSTVLSMMPFICIWFVVRDMRTIEAADQIIVLKDVVVEEKETHKELMKEQGFYQRMVEF